MSVLQAADRSALFGSLSGFKRDILWVLREDDAQKGLAIKAALEEYYNEEVNHSRVYQNLDYLINDGLVERHERDLRTNEYVLTDEAHELLNERLRWLSEVTDGSDLAL